ncbi:MAG TPA: response regulator [Terriglobales bacterium]|nr:response regulator [Terriglobales bacterium]
MGCVLLIDDDAVQLRVRETVLRQAGFQVCVATSGEGALALLRSEAVDVDAAVCDHVLPGIGGPELVRRLRELRPQLPVVVLTGRPGVEHEYAGLQVAFRLKPLPPPELIALLLSLVRRAA